MTSVLALASKPLASSLLPYGVVVIDGFLDDAEVVQGAHVLGLGLDGALELGACFMKAVHCSAHLAAFPLAHAVVVQRYGEVIADANAPHRRHALGLSGREVGELDLEGRVERFGPGNTQDATNVDIARRPWGLQAGILGYSVPKGPRGTHAGPATVHMSVYVCWSCVR